MTDAATQAHALARQALDATQARYRRSGKPTRTSRINAAIFAVEHIIEEVDENKAPNERALELQGVLAVLRGETGEADPAPTEQEGDG